MHEGSGTRLLVLISNMLSTILINYAQEVQPLEAHGDDTVNELGSKKTEAKPTKTKYIFHAITTIFCVLTMVTAVSHTTVGIAQFLLNEQ